MNKTAKIVQREILKDVPAFMSEFESKAGRRLNCNEYLVIVVCLTNGGAVKIEHGKIFVRGKNQSKWITP